MKEYIDKQELLEELRKDLEDDCNVYHSHIKKEIRDKKYEFAIDVIQDAQATDVKEVVHAKWVGRVNMFNGDVYYYCSKCGESHPYENPYTKRANYCPKCGSEMNL